MECCAVMLEGPTLYHTSHTMCYNCNLKNFRNIKGAMKDETKSCAAFSEIPWLGNGHFDLGCLFFWRAIEVGKSNIEHKTNFSALIKLTLPHFSNLSHFTFAWSKLPSIWVLTFIYYTVRILYSCFNKNNCNSSVVTYLPICGETTDLPPRRFLTVATVTARFIFFKSLALSSISPALDIWPFHSVQYNEIYKDTYS